MDDVSRLWLLYPNIVTGWQASFTPWAIFGCSGQLRAKFSWLHNIPKCAKCCYKRSLITWSVHCWWRVYRYAPWEHSEIIQILNGYFRRALNKCVWFASHANVIINPCYYSILQELVSPMPNSREAQFLHPESCPFPAGLWGSCFSVHKPRWLG